MIRRKQILGIVFLLERPQSLQPPWLIPVVGLHRLALGVVLVNVLLVVAAGLIHCRLST